MSNATPANEPPETPSAATADSTPRTATAAEAAGLPEVLLSDPQVIRDPFAVYGRAREQASVAKLTAPGFGGMWGVTRYAEARALLGDPRFEIRSDSFLRPEVPGDCLPYMRTMAEMNGPEHLRLRRLVAPAFGARRAAAFRPRIEATVDRLLDELPAHTAPDGSVDLLPHFSGHLPMDVICEWVGIPEEDRLQWRAHGRTVAAGGGKEFAAAIPGIVRGAKAAVARRRRDLAGGAEPGVDLLTDLIRAQDEDGDRLSDDELVTLVWHVVMAGQSPTHLVANAVNALLDHPEELAALRADRSLLPGAVEELTRWAGPTLLTIPRYATEDVVLHGVRVAKGEAVTAVVAAANRDPRAFPAPDRLDVRRAAGATPHLSFAHGAHFCLGAAVARLQTEVALARILDRFPSLQRAGGATRAMDPGTWRLENLPVRGL
ncbi:cytochrome P450 [Streptomyces candidus]|uniref:Cytochrome P450 n=1 Tax=Streptomyces candidus TaxID=67283 RepID=A0A7X0LR53_9ACTN|nr:cytochrome P450 [Streptomyces candidus]MBB6436606.1 cytochrome P450 [Streptomyces candidus]GHH50743.1 cytochrome P450 [Streptomyces candidus]